ncbi:MAG TPA: GNAT family N-acetyltransferase [Ilumatobacteraceae bacterium]
MAIEIRCPTADEWPAVCRVDARAFGAYYTEEDIEIRRPLHDLSRFRVAFDGSAVASVAASYALDVTLPGGASVPMGGTTWVSTAATHRRRGLMRQVVTAVHRDIDERGEPLATLTASEGGIYEHLGYGIATRLRVTTIEPRLTSIRSEFRLSDPGVRYVDDGDDVVDAIGPIWERFRRCRVGEVSRSDVWHQVIYDIRSRPEDGHGPVEYLVHRDGFAAYAMRENWNDGHPAHTMDLIELAAVTPEAHLALWQTVLGVDLVGRINARCIPIDDPLPFLLDNQRALRTTDCNDGVWVNVLDPSISFGARTYRSTDRIVIEVDGVRWAIEGGPDGGSCKKVRSTPDLVASHPAFSSLLYGGVLPSALVAGRRMTARNQGVLDRADVFFTTSLAPHCQTGY